MKTRSSVIAVAAVAVLLAIAEAAQADGGINVGWYSQQSSPSHAAAGASIHESSARSGATQSRSATPSRQAVVVTTRTRGGAASNLPPQFPSLSTSAPILHDQHPGGPGSFWYTD